MNNQTIIGLELKNIDNEDAVSKPILETALKSMGMVPNIYAAMANNPALLDSYVKSNHTFKVNSDFTVQEQEIILLSISVENECFYCVAAHSFLGDNVSHVPKEIIDAIRNQEEIPNARYNILSKFSKAVVKKRGRASNEDIEAFLDAGYSIKHILGIIAAVGIKTMSNYLNHIFQTPLDEAFQGRAWTKQS